VAADDDNLEPVCAICGDPIGIFYDHGNDWQHFTGDGTAASPVVVTDVGHQAVASWRIPQSADQRKH
jgi:hypothetical protein